MKLWWRHINCILNIFGQNIFLLIKKTKQKRSHKRNERKAELQKRMYCTLSLSIFVLQEHWILRLIQGNTLSSRQIVTFTQHFLGTTFFSRNGRYTFLPTLPVFISAPPTNKNMTTCLLHSPAKRTLHGGILNSHFHSATAALQGTVACVGMQLTRQESVIGKRCATEQTQKLAGPN